MIEINEMWKGITGYPGYQVSNLGNMRRLNGKKISQWQTNWGYVQTQFGTKKKHASHRIVAHAFCENPDNKPFVNHKNGIKHDNRAINLEWCTQSENQKHAFKLGLSSIVGERHPQAKLSEVEVLKIRERKRLGERVSNLAREYNLAYSTIDEVVRRRTWIHI